MWQTGYPFHVMHNYRISAREALEFSRLVHRVDTETLSKIEVVNAARRPLLAYAALVMENLVRTIKPKQVIISVLGVREGLLYSLLNPRERARDPLISAAADLNVLRSRSPHHGEELIAWTDRFMASSGLEETADERRLRHAACLLGDIGWRAHPDYRGEQSMNIIAHGAFVAIDHPGRAYLALSVYFRHAGLSEEDLSPRLRELATTRMLDRARVLGASMRVAYILTAGQSSATTSVPSPMRWKTPMSSNIGDWISPYPNRLAIPANVAKKRLLPGRGGRQDVLGALGGSEVRTVGHGGRGYWLPPDPPNSENPEDGGRWRSHRERPHHRAGYETPMRSTTKTRVSSGPITPPAPCACRRPSSAGS